MNTPTDSITRWANELMTEGWCIVPHAVPRDTIHALNGDLDTIFERTPFCEGGFYGETTKRFGRLLARSGATSSLVQHGIIQGVAERILAPWCDTIQLNVTQAISVHPGAPQQAPHRDQDMWRGPIGDVEYLLNVIWPLTPFTADNGATVVWPRSHGRAALDAEPAETPITAVMKPGDALLFLGSTLHGAGRNASGAERRAVVVGYALGWLKPYENQWLAYPPPTARRFSPELAALIGYRQHRPNLGNFEGRCPSILLKDDVPDYIGAADALRDDQRVMVDAFVDEQRDRL